MVTRPSSPFAFQAVAHALAALDVFQDLPSSWHARQLGIDVDHLRLQYERRLFMSRQGANIPFWQRWTATYDPNPSEDTVLWAERFLRNEFALFCQQTDSHAQERDQILRGLYDVQTRQPATPVVIVRIQELCFLPGVILPWVTAHAAYATHVRAYNRDLRKQFNALDYHLSTLSVFFINHPAHTVVLKQVACLRQLMQEADASFSQVDTWKKQLGIDKKISLKAQKQRIWTPLFKELADLLRPFCSGPKHLHLQDPGTMPEQAFKRASRLMHLSHPALWADRPDLVKRRYYAAV